MTWEVGQKVIVTDTQNRVHEGVVTKIARVNFYVEWGYGRDDPFGIADGRCKNRAYDFGHGVHVYSVEGWARKQRREELVNVITMAIRDFSWQTKFTDEQLEAIAAIIQKS